jgi:hypothetical protein
MAEQRYMIQIDDAGEEPSMPKLARLFAGAGVKLDKNYGPIKLNPARYIVRGWATAKGRRQAEKIRGVRFFSDPGVAQT